MSKIILDNGHPFKDQDKAFEYMDTQLNGKGELVDVGTGFGILETVAKPAEPLDYWKCRISPRTSENEDEVVDLAVQGRQLQVHRGTDVILPESFVKIAEQAIVEKFELRGSALVKTGELATCPIVRLSKSTEKDFKEQIKVGNAIRDSEIRQMNAMAKS